MIDQISAFCIMNTLFSRRKIVLMRKVTAGQEATHLITLPARNFADWRKLPRSQAAGSLPGMKNLTPLLIAGILLASSPAHAAEATVKCSMTFAMKGWSAFYKRSNGTGNVTCSNGQRASVKLSARGGGLTAGKSSIENGQGEFSAVTGIEEIFGSYAAAEAHAGAVKASGARVMTKGEVSLALSGTGRGWDLGVAVGKFTIKRN
jgi:hypothetical protein